MQVEIISKAASEHILLWISGFNSLIHVKKGLQLIILKRIPYRQIKL